MLRCKSSNQRHISQKCDKNLKRNYTLRIDKETGILNSLHIYSQSGNLVEEWNTLKYTVDGEIDENIFDSIQIKN